MNPQRKTLSDLTELYLDSRRGQVAANTVRNDDKTLRRFVAEMGNIQVGQVSPAHVDRYFTIRSQTLQASSLNVERVVLRNFFAWCRTMRFISQTADPMAGRKQLRVTPSDKLIIPPSDFGRLLDSAEHPRDRMIVALGLYTFMRQGEIGSLRVGDVDLQSGEISVLISKSKLRDRMPISEELDTELRRWLTWYSQNIQAPLERDFYLTPAKTGAPWIYTDGVRGHAESIMQPRKPYPRCLYAVKRALDAAGYPTEWQGGHTLRRSGARAFYEHLAEEGHDRAMRQVQAMLHHATLAMTEHYLGMTVDKAMRDKLIKGQRMYGRRAGDNVVQLRPAGEA